MTRTMSHKGKRYKGRVVADAPDHVAETPLQRIRHMKTDKDKFFALSLNELHELSKTAAGCPIHFEHEGDVKIGELTGMVVNGSSRAADVQFTLYDNDGGKMGQHLIKHGYTPQLSLSHIVMGDRLICREVSLVEKGGRKGTYIEVVSATSKTGNSNTSSTDCITLSTTISGLSEMDHSGVAAPHTTNAVTTTQSALQGQPQGQPQAQPPASTAAADKAPEPETKKESAPEPEDVDMTDPSKAADALDKLLATIKDMPPSSERTALIRSANILQKQQSELMRKTREAEAAQMEHMLSNEYRDVFKTLGMDEKAQTTLVRGIVNAKSSNEILNLVNPVFNQLVKAAQTHQNTATTAPMAMVNASAASTDSHKRRRTDGEEDIDSMFRNAMMENARRVREESNRFTPLELLRNGAVAVNASGKTVPSAAPSSDPIPAEDPYVNTMMSVMKSTLQHHRENYA
jgi:hypothetical protein